MPGTYTLPHRTKRPWGSPSCPDVSPQIVASAFEIVPTGLPPHWVPPPKRRRASPEDPGSAKRTVGWMDDLCVRFIANLPQSESQSCERICSHFHGAYYRDRVRRADKDHSFLQAEDFFAEILQRCPQMRGMSTQLRASACTEYLTYRSHIPVRGAILLNSAMDKVLLVKESSSWSFLKGEINQWETDLEGAMREVYEETGFDLKLNGNSPRHHLDVFEHETGKNTRLYIFVDVPKNFHYRPHTQDEIHGIRWFPIADLPTIEEGPIDVGNSGERRGSTTEALPLSFQFENGLARTVVVECGGAWAGVGGMVREFGEVT